MKFYFLLTLCSSVFFASMADAAEPQKTDDDFLTFIEEFHEIFDPNQIQQVPQNITASLSFDVGVRPDLLSHIAIFLPLSGPYKPVGERLLSAIKLAVFNLASENLIIDLYDTKGTPEGALEAFEALKSRPAQAILGPLFSKAVAALSDHVAANSIHLVTLSNDESLVTPYVHVFGLTPQQQVQSLLPFFVHKNITSALLVLQPGPYGEEYLRQVKRLLPDLELDVIWGDKNKQPPLSAGALNAFSEKEFDIIWLPGWERDAISAASQLRYNLPEHTFHFLGSDWYHSLLLNDPSLKNSWFQGADPKTREQFYKSYEELFQQSPNTIELLAYDAMAVLAALQRLGGSKGLPISDFLHNGDGFKTLNGYTRFLYDGQVQRNLPVLEILRQGKVKTVLMAHSFASPETLV